MENTNVDVDCISSDELESTTPAEIKVIEWIGYEDAENDLRASVGCWGGFFQRGMRWKDYFESMDDELKPYVTAMFDEVKKKNLKFSGRDHQYTWNGVPLFSDGKTALFSARGWGDLMAAIWSEVENKDYCYMDFYWT
jgi:ABC-type glycerol-3-phosphate transport system substrate-binding protein